MLTGLFEVGIRVVPPGRSALARAMEIAAAAGQPHPYDALYAAVAEALGCEFWTPDRAFQKAVKDQLPFVHWLGERKGMV